MSINRRYFLAGSAAAAVPGLARAAVSAPGASPAQQQALAAIAAYVEDHRRHFGLPALGLVVVDGPLTALIQSGTRDYERRRPLSADDLWQIGSISKSFVAICLLQLAEAGKLDLEADIRTVLPEAPLPDEPFTIRGLLDHTTGLPDFAPPFGPAGYKLWTGFKAGSHWSYSNTGYDLLGSVIERIDGRPLARSIEARIMQPLGMAGSRGNIAFRDRSRYPASYGPLRPDRPMLPPYTLAPAPWVDASLGAGSVAATLPDMGRYLRFLIGVGHGKGGPLFSDASARLWLAKPVVQVPAVPTETYGLALMHRPVDGHDFLHHTGGMVSFASSFHSDAASEVGAYASTPMSGGSGYRPRLITQFACQAMRAAKEGKPLPTPTALAEAAVPKPADYAGRYAGPGGSFAVEAGAGLTLVDGSTRTPLRMLAPDIFAVENARFGEFPLAFARAGGAVTAADWGSSRFGRNGAAAALPATPERLAQRAGHYQSDDPWIGGFTLVARGDKLYADGVQQLFEIGDDVWRPSDDDWNPERVSFTGFVAGRPQVAVLSGRMLERRDG
ncbi:MAG: hypothetical protein DCF31_05930 [Alphaproteobacteria bacterium]|nr:MAG: hypothetical protein DCF31_05930 [Alphaproteobacteria bacterium]